jgi:SHS2 domain-containing protein
MPFFDCSANISDVYRWVDHTGELEIEIDAPDERAVFEEAVAAVRELTGGESAQNGDGDGEIDSGSGAAAGESGKIEATAAPSESREIEVAAPDRAALLVGWLEELFFLAETQDFVPLRVTRLELAAERLEATVEGRLGHPRHLVKAVTYHDLRLEPSGGRWRARVVLDV